MRLEYQIKDIPKPQRNVVHGDWKADDGDFRTGSNIKALLVYLVYGNNG
jgi:hypothetical protein